MDIGHTCFVTESIRRTNISCSWRAPGIENKKREQIVSKLSRSLDSFNIRNLKLIFY